MTTEIPTKVIVNCADGTSEIVPLTEAELEQRELDRLAYEAQEAERKAAEEEKENLKASANAKLLVLGLTEAEVNALTA
jgi:hypothetical protein